MGQIPGNVRVCIHYKISDGCDVRSGLHSGFYVFT